MKNKFTLTLVFSIFIGLSAICQVPTNGLIGYWNFSGNAEDVSGYGNNGNVDGAILTSDRFGNLSSAYSFDGVNDIITIPHASILNLDGMNSYSISVWLKSDAPKLTATGYRVIEKWVSGSGYPFSVQSSNMAGNNNLKFYVSDNSNIPGIDAGSDMWDNNWHLITFVVDNSQDSIFLYMDDIKIGSAKNTVTTSTTNIGDIAIGNDYLKEKPYKGLIDDIRIYNRALNASEIALILNEGICKQSITVTDTLIINANIVSYNPVTYQNSLKVYPNPSSDHITIDCGDDCSSLIGYTIKITNSLNQTVYESIVTQQIETIDLKTWTGIGVYFIHLLDSKNNTIDIKKIIIQ